MTARLMAMFSKQGSQTLLSQAAMRLLSVDDAAALHLLVLETLVDPAILHAAQERVDAFLRSAGDGSGGALLLQISQGLHGPAGIIHDGDGFAPVGQCHA